MSSISPYSSSWKYYKTDKYSTRINWKIIDAGLSLAEQARILNNTLGFLIGAGSLILSIRPNTVYHIDYIYTYVYDRGYSAAVISGVTREEKLYRRIGFEAFSEATGTADAAFIPMILTRANCLQMQQQIRLEPMNFYPGPVAQTQLTHSALSHRSLAFEELYAKHFSFTC